MGYGVKILNTNNNTLIDSDLQEQMQITRSNSIAGNGSITIQTGEMILVSRDYPTSGTAFTDLNKTFGSQTLSNDSSAAISYIGLRRVTASTPPSRSAGDYGIELYNSSNTVSFTDLFTKGFTILKVYPPGTIVGGTAVHTGSTTNVYFGVPNDYGGLGAIITVNQFSFDQATNSVYYVNYIDTGSFGGSLANNKNPGTLLVVQTRN